MFQALFNSLSGLLGFSRSLDQIGNNVSNMNTPGYRGRNAVFQNVDDGFGTRLSDTLTDTSEGDKQQTSSGTDVAINGKGFFVLHDKEGRTFYTRAGHFRFDDSGLLIDDNSGYHVAALNQAGELVDFSMADLTTLAPIATTKLSFSGNLNKSDTTKQVTGLQVYDTTGGLHTLTATFTNTGAATANSWSVSVKDETGALVGSGSVRFDTTGAPSPGFSDMTLRLNYNGNPQTVSVSFGTPGTFSGLTQLSSSSSVGGKVLDGHGVLGVSNATFDSQGILQITYSNGEQKKGPQLGLATVADEQRLVTASGSLYTLPGSVAVRLGKPTDANFGSVRGSSLELSNVDLTRELTQMIIVQRGYQASSRVMTVTDGMLRDLYSSMGGGGG